MKLLKLLKGKNNEASTKDSIIGDGRAEFLGDGTYAEYESEQETEQNWLEWAKSQLTRGSK